jgi:NTE family protein
MDMNTSNMSGPVINADFIIIGGGIAAVTATQALRHEDEKGSIILLAAEPVFPYNRPLLTKSILTGQLESHQILLHPPTHYGANDIVVYPDVSVCSVHPSDCRVVDQNGVAYQYRKLLIASGARPRELDVSGAQLDGIFKLRTLADAIALRVRISALSGGHAVIVGAGFLGMEVATAMVRVGLKVTMIEQAATAFPKIQSPNLSEYFLDLCNRYKIDMLLKEQVRAFHGIEQVTAVETLSGQVIACDIVVLAIGIVPQTAFLEGSGIDVDGGVVVDEFLQTNAPNVFAAGDVALYPDVYGSRQRTEHWDNAREQGHTAALNMLGHRILYRDVPHYFCEFLDFSFTFLGTSDGAERRVSRGNLENKSFAEFYVRSGVILGLFSTGRPAEETRTVDALIRNRVDVKDALSQLANPAADLSHLARQTILILQGGGALGAFECGVLRAMGEAKIAPDIVGGISIGAINGAIVAGNPHDATRALDSFWNDIGLATLGLAPYASSVFAMASAMFWGIPGFFHPRWLAPGCDGKWWPHQWTSFYDASPVKELLHRYVDFSRLKASPVRLIVGAVDVESGELVFFDSRSDELTAEHILASGSLPPMFPWTTIEGRRYWDGGIISNSPLEHVLMRCGADNKRIIIVDLYPGKRPLPRNLVEVLVRRDEIIYGERIRNDAQLRSLVHEFQALVSEIMLSVDSDAAARLKERPRYVHLMGSDAKTSIIRIVRTASGLEPPGAEYDFSTQAIARHQREGYSTASTFFLETRVEQSSDETSVADLSLSVEISN